MKQFIFLLVFAVSGVAMASADGGKPKYSKVEADYHCENRGIGVAVSLPRADAPAKIWLLEQGRVEGEELLVKKFKSAQCRGCFEFQAMIDDFEVKGVVNNERLGLFALQDKEWVPILTVQCVAQPNN